jgi:hypothetical protein
MAHDQHETATGFNVARYFVEHRHISWVLFAGVLAWGVGAYQGMPKRKDPDIPVRQVAVATPWPGQSAERVEQLVTRKIEEKLAQNIKVSEIKSRSRAGLSVVYAEVDDRVTDTAKEFDDIKMVKFQQRYVKSHRIGRGEGLASDPTEPPPRRIVVTIWPCSRSQTCTTRMRPAILTSLSCQKSGPE